MKIVLTQTELDMILYSLIEAKKSKVLKPKSPFTLDRYSSLLLKYGAFYSKSHGSATLESTPNGRGVK